MLNKIVGVKYFNVFGPNEYHKGEMRSVVLKAFEQIEASGKIQLFKSYKKEYKDGEQLRDFLYVKDAVEMTLFFLKNKKIGGLFNIGSGTSNSWNKLAAAIFDALGKQPKIEYIDMPETIREKYQYYTCADISRIKKAGYSKRMTKLKDAVSDYVKNYLAHGKRLGE